MTAGRKVNSQNKHWNTPAKYVEAVWSVLGEVHLDPASNEHSLVNARTEYSLPARDGLVESWDFPTIYVNPPYGSDRERGTSIKDWLRRCSLAHREHGSEVIALIPVATNTSHWKEYVWGATAICFLHDTRLKFLVNGEQVGTGSPMACAAIYWGVREAKFYDVFCHFGSLVCLDLTRRYAEKRGDRH